MGPTEGLEARKCMCFREFVVTVQWKTGWTAGRTNQRQEDRSTPARDHEVFLEPGSAVSAGQKAQATRCEGELAECQGVERTLGSMGLAPLHNKCVTLGKLFNRNFSLH